MDGFFSRISQLLPILPRAEKAIAMAVIENPDAVERMTLAEIARGSGSSEASIIRFCKRMGYSGYTELKQAVARALSEETEIQTETLEASDSMKTILTKIFQSNVQTLSDTLVLADSGYEAALNALLNARGIHFFGVGDAYAACQLAYMKFSRLGIPCSAHSDVMLQLVTAGNLRKGDVAVAVSYEGRTKNVVQAIKVAREKGATTISITKMNKSPLQEYTDINLFIAISDLTIGRDKVTRRVADQFILDALYLGYITKAKKNYKRQLQEIQDAIDSNKY